MSKDSLWVEKYRPQTISDVVSPDSTQKLLEKIIETKTLTNIMFYGSAGLGKCLCGDEEITVYISPDNKDIFT